MVTKSQELLKARLERYLDKLRSGEKVNERDLKSVLTPAEIESMHQSWDSVKEYKQSVKDMGEELSSYTKKLHTADKIFGIAENHSNLPAAQRTRRYQDAEKHYEQALEHLDEILHRNPGVEIALDRAVSFDPESAPTACPADVPRNVFSRSIYAQSREWETIKSIRIDTLEEKMRKVCGEVEGEADEEREDTAIAADQAEKAKKLRRKSAGD